MIVVGYTFYDQVTQLFLRLGNFLNIVVGGFFDQEKDKSDLF